jgi:hypothetical protein
MMVMMMIQTAPTSRYTVLKPTGVEMTVKMKVRDIMGTFI